MVCRAPHATDRCVLLFVRDPHNEARAKRLGRAQRLFAQITRRLTAAVARLDDVDLVVVGETLKPIPLATRQFVQPAGTFGERLSAAFSAARAAGYQQIVAVGCDTPALAVRHLRRAFQLLETHDLVLGPAADGGAYLIGARIDPAPLFAQVIWQTEAVLAALQQLARHGAVLPEVLGDLDRTNDIPALLHGARCTRALARRLRRLAGNPHLVIAPSPSPPRHLLQTPRGIAARAPPAAVGSHAA